MIQRPIAFGTLIAGSLDIVSAVILSLIDGKSPARMLQGLASGPFGAWAFEHGTSGVIVGLLVHFAIMSVIVTTFVLAARRRLALVDRPVLAGTVYGLMVYVFMYWIVIPLRWPPQSWPPSLRSMPVPMSVHVLLVGIPIALITARMTRRPSALTE